MDLVVTMLTRVKRNDMRCKDCRVDFSESVLNLVALLVETRPVWCKDLVRGAGMGRYSILTVEMLEELFQSCLAQDPGLEAGGGSAEAVVRIVDGFPEWESTAEDMRNRLGRVKGKLREESGRGFYGIYRPIEGLPFCLVPS